ncbi:MAG: WYL domain-containing protein, partial [Alistipes sp.]|nr:WYL domain-containing protein [Alistipes sp.]
HRSQEEVEREPDYSIFEYLLVPTFDFQQELRRYGADLEVLSPRWLREEVISEIHRQIANYIRQ